MSLTSPPFRRLSGALFLASLLLSSLPALAHKVSAVSVVAEFDTKAKTFKVELAMDVDPTGDPEVDDQIPPEEAALSFAKDSLQVYFDDTPMKLEPSIRMVTTSDVDTPAELTRKAVIGTLSGTIPDDAKNFLLHVNENTEAAVVMVTNKDGKPARRLQVLYPGEFSNPVSLAPVMEGDPFVGTAAPAGDPTPAAGDVAPEGAAGATFFEWIARGFGAVLPEGIDFCAFIVAMFLLSLRSRPLGWQVAAYTVGHSLALALAAFKLVEWPMAAIAPVVAISAAYPAIENLLVNDLKPWRPPLIFVFGLAHGLAFGHLLWAFEPEALGLLPAVVGFNVGIELAQFALLVAASLVAVALSGKPWFRHAVAVPLCVLIAGIAVFRLIDVLWLSGG
jgi:hypothetical protein